MDRKTVHIPLEAARWPIQREWVQLDDLCNGVFDCPHSTPVITGAGPFVVRSQDVRTGVFRTDEAARVSEETYQERIARAEPTHGDILYSREGTYFGIAAEVPQKTRVCLGQRMVLIRPRRGKLNSRFLRLWLNSRTLSRHIHGFRDGTVAERLNMPTIRALPIPVFDLKDQEDIASLLGVFDDKIELNRRMNMTLEAMAKALFRDWFVDFGPTRAKADGRQPVGMKAESALLFPDSFQDSPLGEIPTGWRVTELGEICEVIDCLHSKKPERQESGRPLLQLWNIKNDGVIDMNDTYWISDADYKLWVSRLEAGPGDCVITNVGRVAAVAQIPESLKAALGRNMTGIRCRASFQYPTFLIECLLSSAMKDEISLKTDTGTILDALNVRNIPRLRLVRANDAVCRLFEGECRPLRAKLEKNLAESATLAAVRDLLLPKLMSGEIRLKDAEKQVNQVA